MLNGKVYIPLIKRDSGSHVSAGLVCMVRSCVKTVCKEMVERAVTCENS
jgi:hypothetical protein